MQSATTTSRWGIEGDSRKIAAVERISAIIASAVHEQGASTQEIVRSTRSAAEGTQSMSGSRRFRSARRSATSTISSVEFGRAPRAGSHSLRRAHALENNEFAKGAGRRATAMNGRPIAGSAGNRQAFSQQVLQFARSIVYQFVQALRRTAIDLGVDGPIPATPFSIQRRALGRQRYDAATMVVFVGASRNETPNCSRSRRMP